jgi:hypothetical protein
MVGRDSVFGAAAALDAIDPGIHGANRLPGRRTSVWWRMVGIVASPFYLHVMLHSADPPFPDTSICLFFLPIMRATIILCVG